MKTLIAPRYRNSNKIWTEAFVSNKSHASSLIRIFFFSISPWQICLIISIFSGESERFLITPGFYYGSIGIMATTIGIIIGSHLQYGVYDSITSCFISSDKDKAAFIKEILEKHSNIKEHLIMSTLIEFIFILTAALGFLVWDSVSFISNYLNTYLPRFESFNKYGWYEDEHRIQAFYMVIVFSIFISLSLGTAVPLIIRMPILLFKISKLEPILPPKLIKPHFSKITSLYIIISILWMIGVALIYGFSQSNDDWLTYLIITVFATAGAVNFILPQIAYLSAVHKSEDKIYRKLSEHFDIIPLNAHLNALTSSKSGARPSLGAHEGLLALMQHDKFVYPLHQAYVIAVAYLASLIGLDDRLASVFWGSP